MAHRHRAPQPVDRIARYNSAFDFDNAPRPRRARTSYTHQPAHRFISPRRTCSSTQHSPSNLENQAPRRFETASTSWPSGSSPSRTQRPDKEQHCRRPNCCPQHPTEDNDPEERRIWSSKNQRAKGIDFGHHSSRSSRLDTSDKTSAVDRNSVGSLSCGTIAPTRLEDGPSLVDEDFQSTARCPERRRLPFLCTSSGPCA